MPKEPVLPVLPVLPATKREALDDAHGVAFSLAGYRWEARWDRVSGGRWLCLCAGVSVGLVWKDDTGSGWRCTDFCGDTKGCCPSREAAMREVERMVLDRLQFDNAP